METLYYLNELLTSGYKYNSLDLISIIAILSGIFVIVSKNPVVSVLFLIGLFSSISLYLMILGLSFIGLSYLIVYVGAVSILFLFILMLINIRISELQNNTANSIPLGLLIIIGLIYTIFKILPNNTEKSNNWDKFTDILNSNYSYVTSNNWDNNLLEINHISSIGNILYTTHNIWLLITGYILLLAMVGTIVITIKN